MEKEGKKYKESLELFEEIYFKDDVFDTDSFYDSDGRVDRDSKKYKELAKDKSDLGDNRSKIVGKSAFTPKIITKIIDPDMGNEYFFTLDSQGKFTHHFQFPYRVKEIAIPWNASKEEIMNRAEQILNMSNEEVMKEFNITTLDTPIRKIELIIADTINKYLEEKGINSKEYYHEHGMMIRDDEEEISIYHHNERDTVELLNQREEIFYELLTGRETNLDKMKISIKEAKGDSELFKKILGTLEERFEEKKIENELNETKEENETEMVNKEKTGAEKIMEFMKQNNLSTNDLALALSMSMAKTTDKIKAEQHIVNEVNKNKEISENMR